MTSSVANTSGKSAGENAVFAMAPSGDTTGLAVTIKKKITTTVRTEITSSGISASD